MTNVQPAIARAEHLVAEARALLLAGVEELLEDAKDELDHFDGLPVRTNLLRIVGKEESETVYTKLLCWLMDPLESHGLCDSVLRGVLALSGDPHLLSMAGGHDDLDAVVMPELPIEDCRLDCAIVLRGAFVGIEAKIWAKESRKSLKGQRMGQTTYYRRLLENATVRQASLRAMGARAEALAGPRPRIVTMFLRPAGGDAARQSDLHQSITWLEVERILGVAVRRGSPDPQVCGLINSLRSCFVERTGAFEPPLQHIRAMRAWLDHPALRKQDPVTAFIRLSALKIPRASEEE